MANLKWLRAEARGRFRARSRRWRWLGRAPPVRTGCGKDSDKILATQVLPAYRPCRVPLGGLQRIRFMQMIACRRPPTSCRESTLGRVPFCGPVPFIPHTSVAISRNFDPG